MKINTFILSLTLLIAQTYSFPLDWFQKRSTVSSSQVNSAALSNTWAYFWNNGVNGWNNNDQICENTTYSIPVVWNVAVASKVIANSGNPQNIQSVVDFLLNYRNPQGFFSASQDKDDDVYLDDNSQVLWVFISAYQVLGNEEYLSIAQTLINNIMGQWNPTIGGVNQHLDGDYVSSIATLEAALSAVKFYSISADPNLLSFANNAINWIYGNLQDPSDQLIYDGITPSSGVVNKGKLSYTVGVLISTLAHLNQITGEASYIDQAVNIGNAATNQNGALYNRGYWNNALEYVEFLFAGFADLLTLGAATTETQQAAFAAYNQEIYREGNYYYNYYQVGTSGTFVDSAFTSSIDLYNKFIAAYPGSGAYSPDASNFCDGIIGGTPSTSLLIQAAGAELFYQLSRVN